MTIGSAAAWRTCPGATMKLTTPEDERGDAGIAIDVVTSEDARISRSKRSFECVRVECDVACVSDRQQLLGVRRS